ncbi:hypothetical protein HanPI659440_Chr15g0606751 [Helianthus annuus]|nr:hypothetical protein HanPI659440_Chr15g0606751 [Helianthus annuus]
MVMLGESWSVSDLIHSPHEHQLSQSTVCIDLVLKYCSVWLFFNFFYCSKLMVENGAPPVVMATNKDEIMTKVDANIHDAMAMDVEVTEKPSESSPMTTGDSYVFILIFFEIIINVIVRCKMPTWWQT